eukprot:CAMPEP_0172606128 /NCGR_PEP_ID=MMETSP1068-20121228/26319_1 /TAXON_ID=35684 /ORGANISM="Pseudopedinella elastica, Strain CCMP716" /LENGTH=89 /DNA_ID=CAMNT_0013408743 /DNA_START=1072 /DNA_END=1338 /DNA_ORIENTATION=-
MPECDPEHTLGCRAQSPKSGQAQQVDLASKATLGSVLSRRGIDEGAMFRVRHGISAQRVTSALKVKQMIFEELDATDSAIGAYQGPWIV